QISSSIYLSEHIIEEKKYDLPIVYVSTPVISLTECIEIAKFNYEPLKLAEEDKIIKKSKLLNTTRNLYPKASIIADETLGKEQEHVGEPGFKEQSVGLQLIHPIYKGRELVNSRKQAKITHKISTIKIDSIKNELLYSVTEAYLNVLKGLLILRINEKLVEDINKYVKMAEELYSTLSINKKDFLASKALQEQVMYGLRVARLEYEKYLWKWNSAMGIEKSLERNPYFSLDIQEGDLDLYACLQKAERNNFEVVLKKLERDSEKYQYKIRKAKDIPSLKFEGFYGRSASAYLNEEFKFKEDYQFDFKFEYKFFSNLLTASSGKQVTSPKLGQSSITEAETSNITIDLLNNIEDNIKQKEAKHVLNKATYEYEKSIIDIKNKVHETYFNWKKALMQMRSVKTNLALANTEFSVALVNFQDSKISIYELMTYRQKIAKSNAEFFEAKIFYLITLSEMQKLIGNS
ncbi:TolC family protein, partial [bacterium]